MYELFISIFSLVSVSSNDVEVVEVPEEVSDDSTPWKRETAGSGGDSEKDAGEDDALDGVDHEFFLVGSEAEHEGKEGSKDHWSKSDDETDNVEETLLIRESSEKSEDSVDSS